MMAPKKWFYLLLAILCFSSFTRTIKKDLDFKVFYQAGVRAGLHDLSLYNYKRDGVFSYKYSPGFSIMMIPLSLLSKKQAQIIWSFLNVLMLIIGWYYCEKLILFFFRPTDFKHFELIKILTLILTAQYQINNAIQGNINTILWAMMIMAIYFAYVKKTYKASFILSVAISIKLVPGAALLIFMRPRYKKMFFLTSIMTIIFLILTPMAYYGSEETLSLFWGWKTVLADVTHFPFFKYTNQSPRVVLGRFLPESLAITLHNILAISILIMMTWNLKRNNELTLVILAFLLTLLASPVVWIENYVNLTFPLFVLCFIYFSFKQQKDTKVLFYLRLILSHLAVQFFIGKELAKAFAYYGQHFWGLILLVILLYKVRNKVHKTHSLVNATGRLKP